MKKKTKLFIKEKLLNHTILNGKKHTGEKNLLKSLKSIQKTLKKKPKELLKTALIHTLPVFKIHKFTKKKRKKKRITEVPIFLKSVTRRTSLAIKLIVQASKKQKVHKFSNKLQEEFILTSKNSSNCIELKNKLQEQALKRKYLLNLNK